MHSQTRTPPRKSDRGTDEYVDEDDLNRERRAERQRALERGREIDERLAEERRPLMSKDTSE